MNGEIKFRQFLDGMFHYWGFINNIFVSPATSSLGGNPTTTIHQQFTGLKDKNGKEIYEGDIVKRGEGPDEIGEIEKGYGQFYCIFGNAKSNVMPNNCESYEWEVIGNIYEKKLIKDKKLINR